MSRWSMLACCLALGSSSCGDPVRDDAIAALGGEAPGVRHGPLHRPGQPCTLCHDGRTAGAFSLAGTVFRTADSRTPLVGATVQITDATSAKRLIATNAAGNFFVTPDDWSPTFPLWVTLEYRGDCLDMKTQVFRDTACASCHSDPASSQSVGHVYFEGSHADGGIAFRPGCR